MELQSDAITRLELKYCEQCGGLWLRTLGATGSYCPSCERGISQLLRRAEANRRTGGSGPRKRALQRAALHSQGPENADCCALIVGASSSQSDTRTV